MIYENISGDEEDSYKKKLGNFQDTMKSMQAQLRNLQTTIKITEEFQEALITAT